MEGDYAAAGEVKRKHLESTTTREVMMLTFQQISGALSFSIYENVVRFLRTTENRGNAGALV